MQALILAGGEGTRLRPLTINKPKSIVPIGNEPLLLRQIELLKNAQITDIILSLSYKPSSIEKVLGDGSDFGVQLRYLVEPLPLGTAGAYKFAEQFLNTSTIVLNGDILTDIHLPDIIKQHKSKNSLATIVLTEVEDPSGYGLVKTDDNLKVLGFFEKPKADEIHNLRTINAGVYILEPCVLDLIPKDKKYSFEYELFPELLRRKEKFQAFIASNNYWLDIGTRERYLQAHYDLMSGKIKNFKVEKIKSLALAESVEVDKNSIIAKGCVLKTGARIINSILGENVVIEENSAVLNSVIWSETTIGSGSTVQDAIIGCNCRIGNNVSLGKGAVLGDKSFITDFSTC